MMIGDFDAYQLTELQWRVILHGIRHKRTPSQNVPLNPRAKKIFIDRYLGKTLQEIGNEIGISPTRVRQIEYKVIEILRHPANMKRIKEYI